MELRDSELSHLLEEADAGAQAARRERTTGFTVISRVDIRCLQPQQQFGRRHATAVLCCSTPRSTTQAGCVAPPRAAWHKRAVLLHGLTRL
eukprot:362941-Chlamydomonas_euryale.AAC.5